MSAASKAPRIPALDRFGGALTAHFAPAMRRLGDLESRVLGRTQTQIRIDRPVYVCGLARAGSTLLLESLAAAPQFTTHRYADFPFVWTPYWWNALRAQLRLPQSGPGERAHQDRVRVTFESPEAFEEIFWMHFFRGRHEVDVDQVLGADDVNPAFDTFYTAHIRKLLAVRSASRYLAKGNYNLARIGYLLRLFPEARFVIAVREPLSHVASLVRQDRLFCAWSEQSPAVGLQLARSGHFEFGPHKRPLNLGDAAAARAISDCFAAGRMAEGYARQWAASYGWLSARLGENPAWRRACHLVRYDTLCRAPGSTLAAVYAHAGVGTGEGESLAGARSAEISASDYYAPPLTPGENEKVARIANNLWQLVCSLS